MMQKYKTGFTCGAFDLTHAGHYLMFQECKKNCEKLVVGLQTDPSLDRPGKHKPVQSMEERLIQLHACKWIDKVIIYNTEADLFSLLKDIKPDVRFLGEDWRGKKFTGYQLPIPIIYNSRTHEFSSSSLRDRVYQAEKNLKLKIKMDQEQKYQEVCYIIKRYTHDRSTSGYDDITGACGNPCHQCNKDEKMLEKIKDVMLDVEFIKPNKF